MGWKTAYITCSLISQHIRYHIGTLELVKEPGDAIVHLLSINLPWGYIDANGKEYRYISDYQGNIRAVVDSTGTTVQTTDYYPYGLPMATSTGAAANPYKYSGKEFETGSGLSQYDFAARHYPPAAPLFNRPDDKAGKTPNLNPYLYCAANPLRYIDPTGEDYYYNQNGNLLFNDNNESDYVYIVSDGQYSVNENGSYSIISSTQLIDNNGNPITNSVLTEIAGTLYAEASHENATWEEAAAIYSVIENRANADGKSIIEVIRGPGIYGHREWQK